MAVDAVMIMIQQQQQSANQIPKLLLQLQQPLLQLPPQQRKLQQQQQQAVVTKAAAQDVHAEDLALFGGCAQDHVHLHAAMVDVVTQTQHLLHHLLNAANAQFVFHGPHASHADV